VADRFGIGIIGETPAVGLGGRQLRSPIVLDNHKQVIKDMIIRDKNHPSVLVWSLANEPASTHPEAAEYFSTLVNFTRPMAGGRPITYITGSDYGNDQGISFLDMICIIRYYGWSQDGRLDQIPALISKDLAGWRQKYPNKPLLISEYGADTVSGLHNDPPLMFTEEFQKDFYSAYHDIFDNVSSLIHSDTGYFIGELVWNMFDFATEQSINRVGGLNRKRIFTRQRQPKAVAFLIKSRYEQLELVPTPSLS
jgi:beta-glucuronidase